MPPTLEVHSLTPRTCGYITFHGKSGFADVVKVEDCEMKVICGYLFGV